MKKLLTISSLALTLCSAACNKDTVVNSSGTDSRLETVFKDDTYQFTGIAVDNATPANVYVSYPRWSGPYKWALIQAPDSFAKVAVPDTAMQMWLGGQPGENKWVCVQSPYVDANNRLWVLDPAAPNLTKVESNSAKLVLMNPSRTGVERIYNLSSVIADTGYINDVRVDVTRQFAYITNSKEGGIVVVNLQDGAARQVLRAHPSTISDPSYTFMVDGKEFRKKGAPAKFNSDGIALTPDGDWLYYKPATDDKLYRIRTEYLRDFSNNTLADKVEDLGHKCVTDGMIFDPAGNLYLGDMTNYRIVRITPSNNHAMTTVVQDNRLIWPDSYAIANGCLYVTCSQINKQPDYNEGVNKRTTPYTVYRIKI